MPTFLLKTEPEEFSYDDLVRDKRAPWDGVSSNPALCQMRLVRKNDEALIYHTGKERSIVGIAKIICDPYEDPSRPGRNGDGRPRFPLFDIKPMKRAGKRLPLSEIKADQRFKDFALVKQSRLSVMRVPEDLDAIIRELAGL